ncbi:MULTISPECIES: RagB/SusD family nutrient uptake outer membrane protein [Butyricimonas]|uniref:RagB/SusD family nutrient uptake outer membrane protein n=1 Tax=Butyricimonas TaxID=574697 RepID=UPI0007FB50D7|nr:MULTISPECIES: RagB/SusD family nutrient uptake outer membrane protein [Butyricimonas]
MRKQIVSVLLSLFLFTGCDSWLDIVPEEDMTTIDTDFETRDQAYTWLQSCYVFLQKAIACVERNEYVVGCDETVYGSYLFNYEDMFPGIYISTGLQNSLNPYADRWIAKEVGYNEEGRSDYYTAINLCNIFINKIDQVYNMDRKEKAEWKAEVQAVKAYYYFELIRHYGPIVLMDENIDPNASIDVLKQPRSHVDSCFASVVRLCDEAALVLPFFNEQETDHHSYFNKEAALALKARALLYQASPLFNGNPDYAAFTNKNGEPLFSVTEDKEKWKRAAEAAEAAIAACRQGKKQLVDNLAGKTDLQTHMLNIENSIATCNFTSDEVLWMVKNLGGDANYMWKWILPDLNSDSYHRLPGTVISPSLKMVEMFYTANGLPLEQDPTYSSNWYSLVQESDPAYTDVVALNEDILLLHTKREPRFYASIAADRCFWRLGSRNNQNYKVTAYQGEDFGLKAKRVTSLVPENLSGYWIKKWTSSKVDLFNYKSGFQALGESPFPMMRVAELYLIAAEAWNEYEGAGKNAYRNLNVIRHRAGIPDVEVSWEMARDKGKYKDQKGLREIIRQEWNIEFAFEGYRFWNVRRWKTAPVELNEKLYGWNVTGNTAQKFYNGGRPIVVKSDNKFVAPRDYFWPIRSEEVLISGCRQNLGW